jgi:hypothetical protein
MKLSLLKLPVYYINISDEKAQKMESTLRDLGFKDITRFPGVEKTPKRDGIAESHRNLLMHLSDRDLPVIVFEDDISVKNFSNNITIPDDSDALYLGNSCFGLYDGIGRKRIAIEKVDNDNFRIYNMLAAHAIVYLNKEYIDFLIRAINFNIAIKTNQDKARAETMKYWNVYARKEPMFYQTGAHEPVTKITLPSRFAAPPESVFKPFK